MILEIRTYRLKPGTTDEFVQLMRDSSPLLREAGIQVVNYGPSLVAEDGAEHAYLIRAFASIAGRDQQEEAFYGSEAWRSGPREAVLSCIESYHTVVLPITEQAIDELIRS